MKAGIPKTSVTERIKAQLLQYGSLLFIRPVNDMLPLQFHCIDFCPWLWSVPLSATKTFSNVEKDLFSIGLAYRLLGRRRRTTRAYKFSTAVVKWPANLSLSPTDETSFEAGIKVQIHTQDEPPFIDQLGFGVAPGFQTFVSCQEQRVSPGDGAQKIIMKCIGDRMKEKSEGCLIWKKINFWLQ